MGKEVVFVLSFLVIVSAIALFVAAADSNARCSKDVDCVKAINKSNCCTYYCPITTNTTNVELSDELVLYEGKGNYSSLFNSSQEDCACETVCAAVVTYPICQNNLCVVTSSVTRPDYSGNESQNRTKAEYCDSFSHRIERIKCRLENREEITATARDRYVEYAGIEAAYEVCQNLSNEGLCVAIYARSVNCYRLEGERKDKCFKEIAEFREAQISREVNSTENKTQARERVRNYMVLVLYNLQKRVENATQAGRITADEAGPLIERIFRIQKLILEGKQKRIIKVEIEELKAMWRRSKMKDG